jgi:secondary thiamine-phosphate synthase enzyme
MIKTVHIKTKEQTAFYNITSYVRQAVIESGVNEGIAVVFCPHTTAGITINENADPDVRSDLEKIMNHIVREGEPYYEHTLEGLDDMPSHGKSSLFGVSINIPISHSRLNLGTWQGIYLCEFRNHGGPRSIVATIYC